MAQPLDEQALASAWDAYFQKKEDLDLEYATLLKKSLTLVALGKKIPGMRIVDYHSSFDEKQAEEIARKMEWEIPIKIIEKTDGKALKDLFLQHKVTYPTKTVNASASRITDKNKD